MVAAPVGLTRIENGRLKVRMHAGQQEAWDAEQRIIAVIAGSQSGKTSWSPHWLLREIRAKGAGDYLAVTATFPLLRLKMLPEFLNLFVTQLRLGVWHGGDKVFTFHDGQTRVLFGTANRPESLEAATAKAAWADEAGQGTFRLSSYEAIMRRLAINQGRLLLTTTPYNLGWLKQQIFDRWTAGDKDIRVVQFKSTMNPAFPRAEYDRAKATLPDWKFQMFYNGNFSRPAGLIYSDFNPDYREEGGHKVHPFVIPSNWECWGGVDFGGVHTARLLLTRDPEADVYYIWNELLTGDKTSAQHAAEAKAMMAGRNWRAWFGGSKSEDQQRRDWKTGGLTILGPVVTDVEAGIDRVIALWKTGRLYVFDTCTMLLDELGTYSRVLNELGEVTEDIEDKNDFHICDSLRYLAVGIVGMETRTRQQSVKPLLIPRIGGRRRFP